MKVFVNDNYIITLHNQHDIIMYVDNERKVGGVCFVSSTIKDVKAYNKYLGILCEDACYVYELETDITHKINISTHDDDLYGVDMLTVSQSGRYLYISNQSGVTQYSMPELEPTDKDMVELSRVYDDSESGVYALTGNRVVHTDSYKEIYRETNIEHVEDVKHGIVLVKDIRPVNTPLYSMVLPNKVMLSMSGPEFAVVVHKGMYYCIYTDITKKIRLVSYNRKINQSKFLSVEKHDDGVLNYYRYENDKGKEIVFIENVLTKQISGYVK